MSDWPKYESHKIVQAAMIVRVERNHAGGKIVQAIWARPVGAELGAAPAEQFEPSVPDMAEKAEVGGYAVLYSDGFKSISPKQAFEDGYTRCD